jgi:hypothetical protein
VFSVISDYERRALKEIYLVGVGRLSMMMMMMLIRGSPEEHQGIYKVYRSASRCLRRFGPIHVLSIELSILTSTQIHLAPMNHPIIIQDALAWFIYK